MVQASWRMPSVLRERSARAVGMLLVAIGGMSLPSLARGDEAEWAKSIPKEAAFVWHYGGNGSQRDAFEQTAAFEAYHRTGLVSAFTKLLAVLPWEAMTVEASDDVSKLATKHFADVGSYLYQHGFTLAVCLPEGDRSAWSYQLIVIPDAGKHFASVGAWAEATAAASLAKRAAAFAQEDAKLKKKDGNSEEFDKEKADDDTDEPLEKLLKSAKAKEIADNLGKDESAETVISVLAPIIGFDKFQHLDRTIYCLHSRSGAAKMDWACWQEGRDLIVYWGRPGMQSVIDKASREGSLISSRSWQRAWTELEQPIAETSHVWCDVARLLKRYGPTLDQTLGLSDLFTVQNAETDLGEREPKRQNESAVAKLLKPLGIDGIESVAWRSGYHGRHLVDVIDVVTPQARQGLLALYDQPTVSLDQLPPLPAAPRSFSVQAFDADQTWNQSAKIIADYVAMLPKESRTVFEKVALELSNENAVALRRELFASLGNVLCTWSDSDQELLSLGRFTLAISVKDAPALQKTLDRLFEHIQQQGVELSHTATTRHGCPFYVFAGRSSVMKPCAALCDGWLILGLQPQTVEATVLRAKGRLPRWDGDLAKATGVVVPKSFSILTWSDPRGTVRFAMSLLPWLADVWSANSKEIAPGVDFSSLDIPPAELVTQPLFPSVSITVASPNRIRWTKWSSTPMNESLVMVFQLQGAIGVLSVLSDFGLDFDFLEDIFVENVEVEALDEADPDDDC